MKLAARNPSNQETATRAAGFSPLTQLSRVLPQCGMAFKLQTISKPGPNGPGFNSDSPFQGASQNTLCVDYCFFNFTCSFDFTSGKTTNEIARCW